MRLKFDNVELEGKNLKEIDALLERAEKFIKIKQINTNVNQPRGKKSKEIPFPQDEFLINDLAEELGISKGCIHQRLLAMEAKGNAKIVREQREEGQRGKATKVWLVTNHDFTSKVSTKKKKTFNIDLDNPPE